MEVALIKHLLATAAAAGRRDKVGQCRSSVSSSRVCLNVRESIAYMCSWILKFT